MTPARAQPVVIRLPDAPDLQARVDVADAASVTLLLAVPPVRRVAGARAVVEYVTPTGIHRIAGALDADRADPAVVHLRRQDEEIVQRRAWARVDAVVPVNLRCQDPQDGLAATVTLNVSGGGALIHDPIGLPLGTEVRIELELGGSPITATGHVVREAGHDAKGIELAAISEADRERLVRFVNDRQRAELRLRRLQA